MFQWSCSAWYSKLNNREDPSWWLYTICSFDQCASEHTENTKILCVGSKKTSKRVDFVVQVKNQYDPNSLDVVF